MLVGKSISVSVVFSLAVAEATTKPEIKKTFSSLSDRGTHSRLMLFVSADDKPLAGFGFSWML